MPSPLSVTLTVGDFPSAPLSPFSPFSPSRIVARGFVVSNGCPGFAGSSTYIFVSLPSFLAIRDLPFSPSLPFVPLVPFFTLTVIGSFPGVVIVISVLFPSAPGLVEISGLSPFSPSLTIVV